MLTLRLLVVVRRCSSSVLITLTLQHSQCFDIFFQAVEQQFFRADVVVKRAVVVQVVVGDVGENGPGKTSSSHAALHQSVRTHLHEGIFATGVHHFRQ